MENPLRPSARKRDPSVFAKAPVVKPSVQKQRNRVTALRQHLLDQQMPPRMVIYLTQHYHSKPKLDEMVQLYRRGCCLTGVQLADRFDSKNKSPMPNACVPRKDGTFVSLAAHALTQQGAIPDALLIAAARVITAHANLRPAPAQPPLSTVTPPQDSAYARSSFLNLEPGHPDISHAIEPDRQPEPASAGRSAGVWSWDDRTQAMVFAPIEPVFDAQ